MTKKLNESIAADRDFAFAPREEAESQLALQVSMEEQKGSPYQGFVPCGVPPESLVLGRSEHNSVNDVGVEAICTQLQMRAKLVDTVSEDVSDNSLLST